MAEDNVMKSMTLLPEYQEKFLKDLLANVYQVDEESGTISGIAARSPLETLLNCTKQQQGGLLLIQL